LTWPQICEGGDFKTRLAKQCGVKGIPTMVLIDASSGKVVAYQSGTNDGNQFYFKIESLLVNRREYFVNFLFCPHCSSKVNASHASHAISH
jgi:hypothetical protein